jgi:hypothetical protein
MVRGNPRHAQTRWGDHERGRAHEVITYLIGTMGVAIVIAVAVIVAQKAGWLNTVQSAVRQIKLPSLPSAQHAALPDMLPGLTDKVRNVERLTTTLWQRGSERPRRLKQSGAVDR